MRIVTWNVNGIKTLLQYHPWNQKRTYEGIIEDLGGDITCIQETKITRAQMERGMAVLDAYDSFFSFYRRSVRGIHGTAIFTKRDVVVPVKAEEGIVSSLIPSTMAVPDRIGGYPLSSEADLDYNAMKDLDSEGRTTVIDTGMFVLINLYCPNETNSDRLVFKNNFNTLVDRRVRNLIKLGREVIVVGDLNICASDLDTAEPEQRARDSGLENFTDHPPRAWLGAFTGPNGPMIDITRRLHPDRQGMFTCWNTKIEARVSNYGTRLDYILITPGLLSWVKFSDIQPKIVGSDHCPVYLDMYDELDIPGRGKVSIWDELNPGRKKGDKLPDPPAFASRFFSEFSGKQKLLSNFFTKKSEMPPDAPKPSPSPSPQPNSASTSASTSKNGSLSTMASITSITNGSSKKGKGKEKSPEEEKPRTGQQGLSSFFKPPPTPEARPTKKRKKSQTDPTPPPPSNHRPATSRSSSSSQPKPSPSPTASFRKGDGNEVLVLSDGDDDAEEELDLKEREDATADPGFNPNAQSASAWSSIFASKPVPLCEGHSEPSRVWTVNKPGPNKGRRFYLCARPVGPGYDQGQSKIHVNPEYRCNFFQWETKVKRPAGMVLSSSAKKQKT
ncbi:Class II abasic (AP) endonuclease [Rhodotorula toruloides]